MTPRAHVSLSAPLAALVGWKAGLAPAIVFSVGAILIDIDHYLFFVLRTRHFSPIEMFAWFHETDCRCNPTSYYGLHIFHTVETFLLVYLASLFLPVLTWLIIGMTFHMLLDLIWLIRHPTLGIRVRAFSWIEHAIRRHRGEREVWRD